MKRTSLLLACVLCVCPVFGQDAPAPNGSADVQAAVAEPPLTIPGLNVEGSELHRLAPLEHVFSPEQFLWERVPQAPGPGIAVRTELNREAPLSRQQEPSHIKS